MKKGRWERIVYDMADYPAFRCSRCGYKALDNHYNFCPDCGADMREEEELLKKCPFCGGSAALYSREEWAVRFNEVKCNKCGASIVRTTKYSHTYDSVVEAWNRRTHE